MNKPLKNNFLNSLQIIAFGDIGTAWTGPSPYSESNSLFKQIIQSGPSIKITLNKQTEPIVAGFGTGIRFLLLGYFLRFDYAWGIENYKINKGMFYISLNLDF
jgi:outer membrane translocation and assembly module TamA